ncbi:MAG: hypothetical protein AB4050_06290 [Synechococcus sp.]
MTGRIRGEFTERYNSMHWSPPAHLQQLQLKLEETASEDVWSDREFVMLVWWTAFNLTMHFTTWNRVGDKLFESDL